MGKVYNDQNQQKDSKFITEDFLQGLRAPCSSWGAIFHVIVQYLTAQQCLRNMLLKNSFIGFCPDYFLTITFKVFSIYVK